MKSTLLNICKLIFIICIFKFEGVKSEPLKLSFDAEDHPYLVHIAHTKLGLWCSGTIISPHWILTSASCLTDIDTKTFKNKIAEPTSFTVIPASTLNNYHTEFICPLLFVVHKQFDFTTYENDIALIKLERHINLNEAKAIDLANETDYLNSLKKQGKLVNFKRDYKPDNEQVSKDYLKERLINGINENEVTVIDWETCKKKITAVIEDGNVCSLYNPNDTRACTGDIGGPLMVDDVQIGIIAFGIRCKPPSEGVVHTRVDKHLNWIKNQMSPVEWDFRTYSYSSGNIVRSSYKMLLCLFAFHYFMVL